VGGVDPIVTAPGAPVPGGHRAPAGSPPFPGGIAASHLRVYDSVAPDGLAGGTPHCHTVCTEAYLVVAGHGRVATLSVAGYAETPIEAGSFVWFTPGTIHRLLNDGGDLEIVVLMQNAGLPEAGDMVITFADEVLRDPAAYASAAALPELTTSGPPGPARIRRDRGVEGFAELRAGGAGALSRFHGRAAALVRPRIASWRPTWEAGPLAAVEATRAQLDALAAGDGSHLGRAEVHALPPPPDDRRWGCCGTLGTWVPA
jgi:mannose-6-phosphate isomerase-like protein (cupin superfamily)